MSPPTVSHQTQLHMHCEFTVCTQLHNSLHNESCADIFILIMLASYSPIINLANFWQGQCAKGQTFSSRTGLEKMSAQTYRSDYAIALKPWLLLLFYCPTDQKSKSDISSSIERDLHLRKPHWFTMIILFAGGH